MAICEFRGLKIAEPPVLCLFFEYRQNDNILKFSLNSFGTPVDVYEKIPLQRKNMRVLFPAM